MKYAIFFLMLLGFSITTSVKADELNTEEQAQVRELVRDTLLKNPEILMEAMAILQQRQEQAKLEAQKTALKTVAGQIESGPLTPKAGNPKGDITMIEFFDYQCGYCKKAFPGVMQVIEADKNINYVLKEFAILGPESEVAARAALAAQKQDKYMDLHIALMTLRGRLNKDKILKTAASVGIDTDKLEKDMQGDDVTAEINSTRAVAQALGITGTPAFIIGDRIIPGAVPPEALMKVIEEARAAKS